MNTIRYKYVVILKKNNERTTDLLSVLLCFFSALTFVYIQLRSPHSNYLLLIVALAILAGLTANLILSRRKNSRVRYRIWLLVSAIGWIGLTPVPWVAVIFTALAFLESQTKRPLEIGFDPDHIVINTLISRRFVWSDFNNIILKDGLLTLDFKSNRLLQREVVDDEDEDDADEEEFNMFCREQLAASSSSQSVKIF
ncbi:hypothetical protein ACQ86N_27010 [Puia sp. P3]|uniref:hypothetical protein n=1 Tax=Puia sp. P3 TaxID=3423952 RepID=UPI003D6797B9